MNQRSGLFFGSVFLVILGLLTRNDMYICTGFIMLAIDTTWGNK